MKDRKKRKRNKINEGKIKGKKTKSYDERI